MTARTAVLVGLSAAFASSGAATHSGPRRVVSGGMSVQWETNAGTLRLRMDAPTSGWVAVGLNTEPQLAGSLLLMCAVRDGQAICEEHIAQPPRHPLRVRLGGQPRVLRVTGDQGEGRTRVEVELSLEPDGVAPSLEPGGRVHLTLAYSESDDFDHHSRMRTQVPVLL